MPERFPWNRYLSQICCYPNNTEMLGSPHSSHSPTRQRRLSSWSPLLLLRWWRPTLHHLLSHYRHTSLHSDPLLDRNKVMDRNSFNCPMKKQTWDSSSPNLSEKPPTTASLFTLVFTPPQPGYNFGFLPPAGTHQPHHQKDLLSLKNHHQSLSTSLLFHHRNFDRHKHLIQIGAVQQHRLCFCPFLGPHRE